MARALLFALLAAPFRPGYCQAALSETSYEVDIISPSPGGRYRVNLDRGIAVVIAAQNKAAALRYGWRFHWEARSPETDDIGISKFLSFGDIGFGDGSVGIYAKHDIQDRDDLYIGLTHQFLYSGTGDQSGALGHPSQPMPPGEYVFTWHVSSGPTCWSNERGSGFDSAGGWVGKGNFTFTVADEAPWPDLKPSPCAAVAAQASFNATGSSIVSWVVPTTTPLACYEPETVTGPANPCRVTVDPEQARKVSSLMTWVEGAQVTREPSGSGTGSATTPTKASSSGRLFVSFGWMATMLGALQVMQCVY